MVRFVVRGIFSYFVMIESKSKSPIKRKIMGSRWEIFFENHKNTTNHVYEYTHVFRKEKKKTNFFYSNVSMSLGSTWLRPCEGVTGEQDL